MKRYSGLFLEPTERMKLFDEFPRIYFIIGEQDPILVDNCSILSEVTEATKRTIVIPGAEHYDYFTPKFWPNVKVAYTLLLNMHTHLPPLPSSKL